MKLKSLLITLISCLSILISGCKGHDAQLSKEEIQNYLDGRPLVVSENVVAERAVEVLPGDKVVKTVVTGQPITMTTRTLLMNKVNISALTVGKAERINDITWVTPVTFLYRDGANTNGVEATIEHSVNGGKILFLGFQIRKVAKQ